VIVVNPENCTADQQLRLLLHTVSTGVRKKFTVISKEPLLASVSIIQFCSYLAVVVRHMMTLKKVQPLVEEKRVN